MPRKKVVQNPEPEFVSTTEIKLDQEEFKVPPNIFKLFVVIVNGLNLSIQL